MSHPRLLHAWWCHHLVQMKLKPPRFKCDCTAGSGPVVSDTWSLAILLLRLLMQVQMWFDVFPPYLIQRHQTASCQEGFISVVKGLWKSLGERRKGRKDKAKTAEGSLPWCTEGPRLPRLCGVPAPNVMLAEQLRGYRGYGSTGWALRQRRGQGGNAAASAVMCSCSQASTPATTPTISHSGLHPSCCSIENLEPFFYKRKKYKLFVHRVLAVSIWDLVPPPTGIGTKAPCIAELWS